MKARLRLHQPQGAASAGDVLVLLVMALLGMGVGAGWLLCLRRRDDAQVLVEERG